MRVSQSKNLDSEIRWYALYTRSRHEKKVDWQLQDKGIESYLPLQRVLHHWSDRKKWVEEPLFRCYVFIHIDPRDWVRALQTYGAVRIVKFNSKPAIVRDEEIEVIKRILRDEPSVDVCSSVSIGDIVEIIRGPLAGLCGRLIEVQGDRRFIINIDSIHQALRFNVDGADVRTVNRY
jgi:transcription antitermination factor NusG